MCENSLNSIFELKNLIEILGHTIHKALILKLKYIESKQV